MCPQVRRRRPWRSRMRKIWFWTQIFLLLFVVIILGTIGGVFIGVSKLLPEKGLQDYEPTEITKIISSDGVVLAEIFEENREFVPITQIPKDLQNATIAIEDARFYKHLGVDIIGIGRAAYQNFRKGQIEQGGSTLTQQLARNIYLTRQKKLSRKLQEMVLAFELERHYSKEQILELYLNQVFFGSGSYGVQTASKVYFGKDVKDLTLAECALLAGLPQRPTDYSPYRNLDGAVRRRNIVLKRMVELGYITEEQREKARDEKVKLVGLKPGGIRKYKAPWFVTHVLGELTDKWGEDLVYKGGLRVHTTLNYEMQQIAEKALREQVKAAASRRVSQGAMVCIDPHNGYIRAMVGGVGEDFAKDQFNRVTQARRQPGSAFKAFVYTAAIDNGYDPYYRLSNERITFQGYGEKGWSPRNYDGKYGGTYTIKQAIAKSVNICAVRMADKIGIDQVINYARMMGIKSPLSPSLALSLGASGVTPLELCSAYGVFATKGVHAEPMSIIRITGSDSDREGSVLYESAPRTRRVISAETAELMGLCLRAVVTQGTGTNAGRVADAHGKTGTTSDDRDAWFVGFTPELATAVWVGNDDYGKTMNRVWGGNVCAPAWASFMSKAIPIHKKDKEKHGVAESGSDPSGLDYSLIKEQPKPTPAKTEQESPKPDDKHVQVTLCRDSGQLATPACRSKYTVTLEVGSEPLTTCPIHGGGSGVQDDTPAVAPPPAGGSGPARPGTGNGSESEEYVTMTICVDTGHIANAYCRETIPKRFRAGEAPTKVCRLHKPPEY